MQAIKNLMLGGMVAILSTGCAFSPPRPEPPPGAIGRANPMSQPTGQMPQWGGQPMGGPGMGGPSMGGPGMGGPGYPGYRPQQGYPPQAGFRPGGAYPTAQPMPDRQALAHAVAQASFSSPAAHQSGGATCACGMQHGAAPTAPQVQACSCNRFGGCQRCNPSPYGYMMPPPVPMNAYGIDPQEFICDGGDNPPNVAVRRDDSLTGLQPEDTVVHYTTAAGDIEVEASNKVCLYAPRFLSVRKITGALAGGRAIGAAQFDKPQGTSRLEQPLPRLTMTDSVELAHADVARKIDAMRERVRGVPVDSVLQLEQASDVMAALVGLTIDQLNQLQDDEKVALEQFSLAAISWALDECVEATIEDLKAPSLVRDESLQGLTIYEFPEAGRLRIHKMADRTDAKPGEIVNFAIRVENVGDAPVNRVVLTDNLITRLEYVEGSETCSAGAEFLPVKNDGQSLRLQWKLTDVLRVGESATIRFKCRVR
ncbi:MAG: DUF11 domain-containing protein [Planctomycetaceae bacterium]|nr:DUF11 domain-containing protein [Planctomycetaceae bacterium]